MVWIAVWAGVPWLNAGANLLLDTGERSAVWEQSGAVVIVNYAALSFAMVVTVLGPGLIARRVEGLGVTTSKLLTGVPSASFREMNSVRGPLLGAATTALAFGLSALVRDGLTAGVLRAATWFVLGIAIWTFLWTYASLQLGLVRLGRAHVRRDAALVDPGLGLRPFGSVAFMGLWLLLVWLVPVLATGLPDVVGLVIGLLVLAGGLGAFVFSLYGLHRQMVEVKENELALARKLYAEAYEPVREERTLEALERQHSLLGARRFAGEASACDLRLAGGRRHVGLGNRDCDERRGDRVRSADSAAAGLLTKRRSRRAAGIRSSRPTQSCVH